MKITDKHMQTRFYHVLALIFISLICACQIKSDPYISIFGSTMGTTYSVKYQQINEIPEQEHVHSSIEKILSDINQSMSTYIDDSELSLFNRSRDTGFQKLSDDLYKVIKHANQVRILSNGAFDVTVGPLVNLWGVGPDPMDHKIPTDDQINELRQHTGFAKIQFDPTTKSIAKSEPDMYIDLSGIAKGFAVDKLSHYLDSLQIENYLIEIGGELIGKGINSENNPWQIGIEQAKPLKRSVQQIINLENMAMATSGDYRNYFEQHGVRYSHTIDPVNGKPILHRLASISVLDKSTMHADAMATAFMVMGSEKSMALAEKLNIPIYMIIKTDKGFEERYNKLFETYFSN